MSRIAAPLIVGVDGGNSKTDIILADTSGHLLGWVRVAGTNYQAIGLPATVAIIRAGIGSLLATARRSGEVPEVLSLCMAGIDTPRDARAVRAALRASGAPRVARRIVTRNDSEAGLRVATTDGVGIALVGGAGVNAIGVNEAGKAARFASLGDLSGDFGGGAGIGLAGLGAAVRASEGRGPKTSLGRAILAATGRRSLRALLDDILDGSFSGERIGRLAPVVLAESERGDRVARDIEALMSEHAAAYARAAFARAPIRRRPVPIVLIGSTILSSLPGYRSRMVKALSAAVPHAEIRALRDAPVLGALLYGLDESSASRPTRRRAEATLRTAIRSAKPTKLQRATR